MYASFDIAKDTKALCVEDAAMNKSEKNKDVWLIKAVTSTSVGGCPCPSKKVMSSWAEKDKLLTVVKSK